MSFFRSAAAVLVGMACPATWGQETIAPKLVRDWQTANKRFVFVDVRSAEELGLKHIDGAINIPHSGILSAKLPKKEALVLCCTGEGCSISMAAGGELIQNGYKKVFVLDGGLAAWEAQGLPIVADKSAAPARAIPAGRVSPRALSSRMKKDDAIILDARPALEFSSGHLPGALNVPLETLEERLGDLDKAKRVVVYDRLSERTAKAGELLLQKGFAVEELSGGIAVWIAMKLPVDI